MIFQVGLGTDSAEETVETGLCMSDGRLGGHREAAKHPLHSANPSIMALGLMRTTTAMCVPLQGSGQAITEFDLSKVLAALNITQVRGPRIQACLWLH